MSTIPQHLGIIMDGNRRWAKERGLSARQGHTKGQETLRTIARAAFEKGVTYISVYAFSTENWKRTEDEVGHLMKLLVRGIDTYTDEFNDAGVKVVFLGERADLDTKILRAIEKAEQKTAQNNKGTLAVCFNYGGQRELVSAVQQIADDGVAAADITEETIAQRLYQPDIPPVDLVVRTSGEQRLSNFMLWRAAYSEFIFIDKHWPDFSPEDLDEVLLRYAERVRRFGQ